MINSFRRPIFAAIHPKVVNLTFSSGGYQGSIIIKNIFNEGAVLFRVIIKYSL